MKHVCLFILFLCAGAYGEWLEIPGCPSIFDLNQGKVAPTENGEFPSCYCDNATEDTSKETGGVEISCILFGRLEHMSQAIKDVHKAGYKVWNIHANGFTFPNDEAIPANFFKELGTTPKRLSLNGCNPPDSGDLDIKFNADAFRGLEDSLEHLDIKNCDMTQIPTAAFSILRSLKVLDLHSTLLIRRLPSDAFRGLVSLEKLDVSENDIKEWESGVFNGLQSLEDLALGPRNVFNESLFEDLNSLPTLKKLNLGSLSLKNLTDKGFQNLTALESLSLVSNDLSVINQGDLDGLRSLKELDLRVNLIQKVQPESFRALENLLELRMAGNYFNGLQANHFRGMGKLENLDLSFNEFSLIPNDTFLGLNSLLHLDLKGNAPLSLLHSGAFNGLPNLQSLNLSEISVLAFSDKVFAPLPQLKVLNLEQSRLGFVHMLAFANNTELEELYVDGSNLRWLPPGITQSLTSLKVLNVSGNPWLCDDRMLKVKNEIMEMVTIGRLEVLSPELIICNEPPELQGKPILQLPDEVFQPFDPTKTAAPTPPTAPPTTTTTEKITEKPTPRQTERITSTTTKKPTTEVQKAKDPKPKEQVTQATPAESGPSRTTIGIAVGVIILCILIITAIVVVFLVIRKKKQTQVFNTADTTITYKKGNKPGEEDMVENGKLRMRTQPDGDSTGSTPIPNEAQVHNNGGGHTPSDNGQH